MRIMREVADSQIFTNSIRLNIRLHLRFNCDCSARVAIPCLVICLTYVSLQVLQCQKSEHIDRLAAAGCSIRKTLLHFFHHGDNTALKTQPNILINV